MMASTWARVLNRVLLKVVSASKLLSLLSFIEFTKRSCTDHQYFLSYPLKSICKYADLLDFSGQNSAFFCFSPNRSKRQYRLKSIRGRVLLVYYCDSDNQFQLNSSRSLGLANCLKIRRFRERFVASSYNNLGS